MSAVAVAVTPLVARVTIEATASEVSEVASHGAQVRLDVPGAMPVGVVQGGPTLVALGATPPTTITIDVTAARVELASAAPQGPASDVTHDDRDTLVHNLAETSDTELEYSAGSLVRSTVWTTAGHTVKVRETLFTYVGGDLTSTVTTQHDGAGAVVSTLSKAFAYTAGDLVGVTTTLS